MTAPDVASMSPNCRNNRGRPNTWHHCTGGRCECESHGVRPPVDFRARVEARKAERAGQTPSGRGAGEGARPDAPNREGH